MLTTRQQQRNLKYNGFYYHGWVDGIKGSGTRIAIKAFQKACGLTVDGIWGQRTDAKSIALAKELQRQLNAQGYKLAIDGIIGSGTIKAIKAFQKKNKLATDGIVGPATKKLLAKKQTTWNDIKHFKKSEFACDCGGRYCDGFPVEMDLKLVKLLDKLRDYYDAPITVTSGVRCRKRNAELAGSSSVSKHMEGKAADIYISGVTDTRAGRDRVIEKAYSLGAEYCYANTPNMGNAVHINI